MLSAWSSWCRGDEPHERGPGVQESFRSARVRSRTSSAGTTPVPGELRYVPLLGGRLRAKCPTTQTPTSSAEFLRVATSLLVRRRRRRLASAIDCAPTTKQWHASNKSPSCCGDVVVTLDAAHILAARKTALHPQKNADGHRSLICDAIGSGTDPSVIFCAFLWMSSGLLRAHGERTRQADPWNAFARGVLGGKYLIAVSARTVCARRIDSHPLSCRRCQEPPSTTCRALDRRRLGGSRHRRRSDSRARRASSALAESSHGTFRSRWPGGTGG